MGSITAGDEISQALNAGEFSPRDQSNWRLDKSPLYEHEWTTAESESDISLAKGARARTALSDCVISAFYFTYRGHSYYPSFSQPPPPPRRYGVAPDRSERTRANNTNSAHGRYRSHLAIYFFKHTPTRAPRRERGFRERAHACVCVFLFPFLFFFSNRTASRNNIRATRTLRASWSYYPSRTKTHRHRVSNGLARPAGFSPPRAKRWLKAYSCRPWLYVATDGFPRLYFYDPQGTTDTRRPPPSSHPSASILCSPLSPSLDLCLRARAWTRASGGAGIFARACSRRALYTRITSAVRARQGRIPGAVR